MSYSQYFFRNIYVVRNKKNFFEGSGSFSVVLLTDEAIIKKTVLTGRKEDVKKWVSVKFPKANIPGFHFLNPGDTMPLVTQKDGYHWYTDEESL